jgi:hypothetical protein
MAAYRNGVVAATGKPVLRTLIHFPSLGQVYEIVPLAVGTQSPTVASRLPFSLAGLVVNVKCCTVAQRQPVAVQPGHHHLRGSGQTQVL